MGRVAIVTGGASGIGRATADRLRARGETAVVFDVTPTSGDSILVDLGDPAAITSAVTAVRRRYGPIDTVVNAAGVGTGGPLDGDQFVQTWHRTLDVNLSGPMHLVRACLADLLASGSGRVVNVASTEALTATRGTSPYTVSKHALLGFTRSLAVDYGRQGLTANCVCPGATDSTLTAAIPQADKDRFARRHIPVGRYAHADEIAYIIATLTAVEASFVNGAVIVVDGGMTAQAN
jgi:3-oxoacyl-[acyl-carrier protein] reductase